MPDRKKNGKPNSSIYTFHKYLSKARHCAISVFQWNITAEKTLALLIGDIPVGRDTVVFFVVVVVV